MKPFFRSICLVASLAAVVGVGIATPSIARQTSGGPESGPPRAPTAAEYGYEPALKGMVISPDGKHLVAIVSTPGQEAQIAVWQTDNPSAPPKRIGCGPRSTCAAVRFIKNDRLAVTVRQLVTLYGQKTHAFRLLYTNLDGSSWLNADGDVNTNDFARGQVLDDLPKDPKNVLVAIFDRTGANGSTIPDGGFYKVNVYTGAKTRVYMGSDRFSGEQLDLEKEVRARQEAGFENGNVYFAQWIKDAKGQWAEHFRWYAKDREPTSIVGFTHDPNIVYIATNKGRDKVGIYEYDIAARQLKELIFETKFFDATGVIQSGAAQDEGALLGFTYDAETFKTYYTDPLLDAMVKGARKALGVKTKTVEWVDIATGEKGKIGTTDGFEVRLNGWSDDRKVAVVVKAGPRQPTEYYLLKDGTQLTLLGKARPWIDTRILGDMRVIQYPARDGLMVPGLLTTPRPEIYGPGPYPTIVVPHGGPWARDYAEWDGPGWVQYFAARGYAVLQPQFRGSEGWGQKLWRAGDAQWGLKMQDDKDDGAKWLIAQGIAAPDRIAMHGYSYGGYSAMVASFRPNGIYQCAVAGAGVASMERIRTQALGNRFQREYQRPSLDGLSPIDHFNEVSIPIFLYHGDRDTNVVPEESERFVAGVKAAGKPVKFQVIPDMGHESARWSPGDIATVLTAVETYLTTECGPGGL